MQPSTGARYLGFGLNIRLVPYYVFANCEGSGETAQMYRLTWTFAGRLCDKELWTIWTLDDSDLGQLEPRLWLIRNLVYSC